MSGLSESCRTSWGARVLGLVVLLATVAMGLWLQANGGAPTWTWVVLGAFALVSGLATLHNFGDRWDLDDEGLSYRNTITGALGFPRERRVEWAVVVRASEYDGRTWFLTVEGGKRWVLDQLAEHDRLGLVFQQLDIPVATIEKPRPWSRDGRDPSAPR